MTQEHPEPVVAEHGEKTIEIRLRLWTNEISPVPDTVIPKHAWSSGMVTVVKNESHGIPSSEWRPFHSLLDLGRAIERALIDQGITLHPSDRAQKYMKDPPEKEGTQ